MCTLVVKEKNGTIPTDKALFNCFENNPDGAGIAYWHNGIVYYEKGFMTYDDFFDAYDRIMIKHFNSAMLLHFRIGTHGGNIPENTHPFMVTNNYHIMQKLQGHGKYIMAHNGIFHNMPIKKSYSDTMVFNADILYPLYKYMPLIHHKAILDNMMDGSKIAILHSDNTVHKYGDFIEYDDGLFFSNKGYEKKVYCKPIAHKKYKYIDTGMDDPFDYEDDSQALKDFYHALEKDNPLDDDNMSYLYK